LAQENSHIEGQAESLLCLATLDYFYVDDMEAAGNHLLAALQVTASLGDNALNATIQHRMGMVATETGDLQTAHACFQESLRQWEALGDRNGSAEVRMWQGWLAIRQGDFQTAQRCLVSALRTFQALKDRLRLAMLFFSYADLAGAQGHAEEAARHWGVVHSLVQELGASIPPRFRTAYERGIASLRNSLGESAFDAAFAAGGTLSLEDATTLLLQVESDT